MSEMPEEIWVGCTQGYNMWSGAHNDYIVLDGETRYTRTDLIETLKKTHIEHTTLEEEDYYPTF